ncbi:nitroreductase/quinone reductase family protein [Streptomyces chartreusis]|uniref:nitroreductase/quinone reductase family protein n=1 Tax=Streptomyces chartreusis TaxID=1969 RepID=UPI00368E14D3
MQQTTPAQDSPLDWVRDHVRRYVDSGGEDGHYLMGLPTLVLTTVGRRTGQRRRTGATYGRVGDYFVIIASAGGSPKHPLWYLNLLTTPEVEVQVGSRVFAAVARVVPPGVERDALWHKMCRMSPQFADLQTRTIRQFPLVVLQPIVALQPHTAAVP